MEVTDLLQMVLSVLILDQIRRLLYPPRNRDGDNSKQRKKR